MDDCRSPSSQPKRMQEVMIELEGPNQLLYCSSKGDKDGVIQEIEKGVSPNLADYDKRTAVHLAPCEGRTEIVELLLEKGADVNSVDCWEHTRSMNYLHPHKPHAIRHRDLSPSNILQDEAACLKVTDFGFSKTARDKNSSGYKMTCGMGSYRCMAPEVFCREGCGKNVDVFSFALIMHEMFQGEPSHRSVAALQLADQRAYEDARPSSLPSSLPSFTRKKRNCFCENAGTRIRSIDRRLKPLEHAVTVLSYDQNHKCM